MGRPPACNCRCPSSSSSSSSSSSGVETVTEACATVSVCDGVERPLRYELVVPSGSVTLSTTECARSATCSDSYEGVFDMMYCPRVYQSAPYPSCCCSWLAIEGGMSSVDPTLYKSLAMVDCTAGATPSPCYFPGDGVAALWAITRSIDRWTMRASVFTSSGAGQQVGAIYQFVAGVDFFAPVTMTRDFQRTGYTFPSTLTFEPA